MRATWLQWLLDWESGLRNHHGDHTSRRWDKICQASSTRRSELVLPLETTSSDLRVRGRFLASTSLQWMEISILPVWWSFCFCFQHKFCRVNFGMILWSGIWKKYCTIFVLCCPLRYFTCWDVEWWSSYLLKECIQIFHSVWCLSQDN